MTTVTNMKDLALDLADMTGQAFPVEARLIDYANTALRFLHNKIVNAHVDYFRSEQSISVVAGTETYAVPSDYYKTKKVWYETGERRFPVKKFDLNDIQGWRKSPISAGTLKHWYVQKPTLFTALADTLAAIYPVGSEDFISYHMALQLLARAEKTDQFKLVRTQRDDVFSELSNAVAPRDEEEDVVGDYYGRWEHANAAYSPYENRYFRYRVIGSNMHILQRDAV